MSPPTGRLDDAQRLALLRETGLLDTPTEEAFDRLTRLAARLLDAPIALVTLVDGDRQFFKSCIGLPEPWASSRETPLTHSFCQHVVSSAQELVIEDARHDPRVAGNLAITDIGVIAYVGVPLTTASGHILGTICVIDTEPRQWAAEDLATLRDLGAAATTEIDLRLALSLASRSTAALQAAYREREDLLGATTDGVYTTDLDGVCLYVNRAGAELLGYTAEAMVGHNAHELFHHRRPDGSPYPQADCPIVRATRTGRSVQVNDEVFWRRDGTPLPVAYATSPVWRDDVETGVVVRFTDITEQRRATEDLRLLADTGRALSSSLDVDTTLDAVARIAVPVLAEMAMVDVLEEGGQTMRRSAATCDDPHLTELLARARQFPPRPDDGGPQAEVLRTGTSLLVRHVEPDWLASVARGAEHAAILEALGTRSIVVAPLRARDSVLGTLTLVRRATRSPFDDRDVALAEEIGRRAALAVENARLYDAARHATRARDDMLGVVSHDLRNPLNTIFMGSSFLLELLPDDKQVERTQAAAIKRSAERANRMIQDLLDVRQIERGQLSLECRPQAAAALVDEAVEQARMLAADRGITLERGPTDEAAMVTVDRDRMLQALGNLTANALKFTPRGGRVTVSARRDGDSVHLSVSDTGPGIAPEHVPNLFDRYWQANRRDRRGVGLGLSIVKGIAEGHGGTVRVGTAPGRGSTFTIALPAATA